MVLLDAEFTHRSRRAGVIRYYIKVLVRSSRTMAGLIKFSWLFWVTNMAFAAALTIPIATVLSDHLGNSLINQGLVEQFDFQWYLQFRSENRTAVTIYPPFIYSIALIYMLIQLFYTGGLLSVILNKTKDHIVDFFYGGVKYFLRFTKIFFVISVLYIIALMTDTIIAYGFRMILDNSPNAFIYGSLTTIRYLIFMFFITLINIMADYSKVIVAVKDSGNILRVINDSLVFIGKNADKVFVIYLIISSFVAVAAISYNIVDGFLPKRPLLLLLPAFIIQQILIIFRVLIKMYFFTSEVYLFQDLASEYTEVITEEIKSGDSE